MVGTTWSPPALAVTKKAMPVVDAQVRGTKVGVGDGEVEGVGRVGMVGVGDGVAVGVMDGVEGGSPGVAMGVVEKEEEDTISPQPVPEARQQCHTDTVVRVLENST